MLYFRVGESDDAWFSVCYESPLTSRAAQVTLPLFPPRQAIRSVMSLFMVSWLPACFKIKPSPPDSLNFSLLLRLIFPAP